MEILTSWNSPWAYIMSFVLTLSEWMARKIHSEILWLSSHLCLVHIQSCLLIYSIFLTIFSPLVHVMTPLEYMLTPCTFHQSLATNLQLQRWNPQFTTKIAREWLILVESVICDSLNVRQINSTGVEWNAAREWCHAIKDLLRHVGWLEQALLALLYKCQRVSVAAPLIIFSVTYKAMN